MKCLRERNNAKMKHQLHRTDNYFLINLLSCKVSGSEHVGSTINKFGLLLLLLVSVTPYEFRP